VISVPFAEHPVLVVNPVRGQEAHFSTYSPSGLVPPVAWVN